MNRVRLMANLSEARGRGLPATMTLDEWAAAIEHFEAGPDGFTVRCIEQVGASPPREPPAGVATMVVPSLDWGAEARKLTGKR